MLTKHKHHASADAQCMMFIQTVGSNYNKTLMTLEQLGDGYYLCDGEILSINVSWVYTSDDGVNYSNASVDLKIRKKIDKKYYESCIVRLTFKELEEIGLLEDSKTGRD